MKKYFNLKINKNKGFTHQNFLSKVSGGFTIIETMIAIALFSVIITVGSGSLLSALSLYNKSQNMRSVIDNLSFIMEDISRNLRTGYNYNTVGTTQISFTASDGNLWIYKIDSTNIEKSIGGGAWIPLNSSEITFAAGSGFTVTGVAVGDNLQPFVTIKLIGEINKKNIITPFSLQTSVSQRRLDI